MPAAYDAEVSRLPVCDPALSTNRARFSLRTAIESTA